MAKKKKTREEQYAEILTRYGKTLAQCYVFGFSFGKISNAYIFHYHILRYYLDYLLFDVLPDGNVIIVISKDSEHAERIREIAEQDGGEAYKPNLKIAI